MYDIFCINIIYIYKGPPGSTTAQLLGRNHGYVFYEGDAFIICANPFIDPNIEMEGWQQQKQKPLKVNFKTHYDNFIILITYTYICNIY